MPVYSTLSAKGIFLTKKATPQISGNMINEAKPNLSRDAMWIGESTTAVIETMTGA